MTNFSFNIFKKLKKCKLENLKKFNREHQLPIYGILGVFQLLSGWFIVLITERTLMGHIEDNEIYLATKCIILPIPTHIFLHEEEVSSL